MATANPVFVPEDLDQLDVMVEGLKQGLKDRFTFTPSSQQKLRDVVLSTLLFDNGVQQWQSLLNQKLELPKPEMCNICKQLLPDTIWVATDANVEYLGVFHNEPSDKESCGDDALADLWIFNARDAVHADDPIGEAPTESAYWAYIANMFRVERMSVAMPNIEEYGVLEAATDTGGIEFLKNTLWLQHINEEMCVDPIDRGDDGSDTIWIKLTRI
ncbi:hypothetical protein [Vibrio parahaemolyticus]|uniref:hypothetical protein n=1 Tax=Vibrio parahaemolyticus TaxID=670 RepID=UPI003D816156